MTDDPTELHDLASAYLDDEVSAEERVRVESDPELLARVEELRRVAAAVGRPVPPLDDAEAAAQRRRARLAGPEEAPRGRPAPPPIRRRPTWLPSPAAAAAVIVVIALVGVLLIAGGRNSDDADTAASSGGSTTTGAAADTEERSAPTTGGRGRCERGPDRSRLVRDASGPDPRPRRGRRHHVGAAPRRARLRRPRLRRPRRTVARPRWRGAIRRSRPRGTSMPAWPSPPPGSPVRPSSSSATP